MSDAVLQIDEHRHAGQITLALTGELDIVGGELLRARLDDLRRTYRGRLVIDLGGLTFLSSTGIAVLMHAHGYARTDGWRLQLRQGPPEVRRVFELCGLLEHLPFTRG
jgi:stage II sporulation protein AA (anti-sigma F factor antagonist)